MPDFFSFLEEHFGWAQIGLATVFVLVLFWINQKKEAQSKFRVREADRLRVATTAPFASLAEAKYSKPPGPHLISGIRLDVPPHELFGISPSANKNEILSAYKNLMRQYHPDRVGPPGSQSWKDAQEIAQKINEAKEFLLERIKKP